MKLSKKFEDMERNYAFVLTLTALAWMAFTLPQVQAGLVGPVDTQPIRMTASAFASQVYCLANYSCVPLSNPPALSVKDSNGIATSTVVSGTSATVLFTVPINTVMEKVAVNCPTGVIAYSPEGVNICNSMQYAQILNASYTMKLINSTSMLQPVSAFLYVYPYSNPNAPQSVGTTVWVMPSVVATTTPATTSPMIGLLGSPTIIKQVISSDMNGNVSTSYSAKFNVTVTAGTMPVSLGMPNTAKVAFAPTLSDFVIFKNGLYSSTTVQVVSYAQPVTTTLSADGTYFTIAAGQSVTIPVTASFIIGNAGANGYAVQMQGMQWFSAPYGATVYVNSMMNNVSWRTNSI